MRIPRHVVPRRLLTAGVELVEKGSSLLGEFIDPPGASMSEDRKDSSCVVQTRCDRRARPAFRAHNEEFDRGVRNRALHAGRR